MSLYCFNNPQVFKNPHEVVTVLLIQTLGAMVPSIPVCLSTAVDGTDPEQRLDALLELNQTALTLGRNLEAAMMPHLGLCRADRQTDGEQTAVAVTSGCVPRRE